MTARASKDEVRTQVWDRLQAAGAAAFPFPPHGRIPNFVGANRCVAHLRALPEYRDARALKCNPDAPQRAIRQAALEDGKVVFMAVPRLTQVACFIRLDPRRLAATPREASSIKGASAHGEPVTVDRLDHIDLVVAGSVAVDAHGARVGKGGGYSDMEWALASAAGAIDAGTLVVTSVHPLQQVETTVPMLAHDIPVDVVITPEGAMRRSRRARPAGILWDLLSPERIASMPAVAASAPHTDLDVVDVER